MLQARDQNRVFDAADASTGVEPVATRRPAPRPPHLPPLHSHRAAVPRRPECGDARRRRRPPSRCRDCRAAARRCLPSRRPPRDRALPAAVAAASRCLPVRRVSIARRHCSKQLAHTPYGLKPPGRHFESALRVAISMDHAPRQRTRRVFISLFLNPQRHRNSSSLDLHGFRDSSDRLWCTSGRLLHRQSVQKVRAMKYPKELDITPEVGFNHSNISQYFHMLAPC